MSYPKGGGYHETHGYSAAISSLLHAPTTAYSETKQGSYIYTGDAANFHEWQFRTKLRFMGVKDSSYAEQMSKVVDGLGT